VVCRYPSSALCWLFKVQSCSAMLPCIFCFLSECQPTLQLYSVLLRTCTLLYLLFFVLSKSCCIYLRGHCFCKAFFGVCWFVKCPVKRITSLGSQQHILRD
jgi:hypothetical protein